MWDLLKQVITFHKGSLMIWNCCQMDSRWSVKLWSNAYVMDLFITTIHTTIHLGGNYSYDQYQSPRYPHKSPNYIYSSQCNCVSWCSKCILRRNGSAYVSLQLRVQNQRRKWHFLPNFRNGIIWTAPFPLNIRNGIIWGGAFSKAFRSSEALISVLTKNACLYDNI